MVAQCFVSPSAGINSAILLLIMLCALSSMNYCCLAMYMIYITFNFFQLLCMIGLTFQNGTLAQVYAQGFNMTAFQFTLSLFFLVYYAVAWPLCFHAFKEFKAML